MARQLAAAAVLEKLVEAVGVHDIIGKQHKPEPKEPQVMNRSQTALGQWRNNVSKRHLGAKFE